MHNTIQNKFLLPRYGDDEVDPDGLNADGESLESDAETEAANANDLDEEEEEQ